MPVGSKLYRTLYSDCPSIGLSVASSTALVGPSACLVFSAQLRFGPFLYQVPGRNHVESEDMLRALVPHHSLISPSNQFIGFRGTGLFMFGLEINYSFNYGLLMAASNWINV